ncbi:MAG TPA: phospholipase D-like domain-containing protein [Chloroflexota bacterium]|nr:phospholipase D-like domain-containing protein [Chloroflexota bacterium]
MTGWAAPPTLNAVTRSLLLRPLFAAALLLLLAQPASARVPEQASSAPFTLLVTSSRHPDPLLALIGAAGTRVLVESTAITDPPLIAALIAARARGVDVRAMADPHSASSGGALSSLAAHDVWVRRGNPAYALTGETVVVIDAGTLVISNAPLTLAARATQRRFLVVDHDAKDVEQGASVFYDDWERQTPNRFGDHTVLAPPDYQATAIDQINSATRTLDIMAETLDSGPIVQAILAAAARNVQVRVLLDPSASQAVLLSLLTFKVRGGVLPLGFSGSAVYVDQDRVLLGSASLSDPSLLQQREFGLLVRYGPVNREFTKAFDADWKTATHLNTPPPTATPTTTPKGSHGHGRGTPTATPTPPATPTLPPTAIPSTLTLNPSYNSSVRIGGRQEIVVRTIPRASVSIVVTYPDGSTRNQGTTQGSGQADATGSFVDAWYVSPSAATGTAKAVITVTGIGQTQSVSISFQITL